LLDGGWQLERAGLAVHHLLPLDFESRNLVRDLKEQLNITFELGVRNQEVVAYIDKHFRVVLDIPAVEMAFEKEVVVWQLHLLVLSRGLSRQLDFD